MFFIQRTKHVKYTAEESEIVMNELPTLRKSGVPNFHAKMAKILNEKMGERSMEII